MDKKMEKISQIIMVSVFIVFIFGFAVWSFLLKDRKFSEMENRNLAQFPEFTWKNLKDGTFTDGLEKYMSDQLPFKDELVTLKTDTERLLMHDLQNGAVQEDYIGRFGIGLLSCFLVSDVIRVQTRSCQSPEQSLEWCGNPDGTYTIAPCAPLPEIGTRILLTPKAGAEAYFTPEKLTSLVQYYGLPLPEPIYLVQGESRTLLNPPFPSGETQYGYDLAFAQNNEDEAFNQAALLGDVAAESWAAQVNADLTAQDLKWVLENGDKKEEE